MKRKILITESDVDIKFLLSALLKKRYEVTFLHNARLLPEGNFEDMDLFILNSHLSDADIIEVCRRMKENPRTGDIPILIIAGSEDMALLKEECPGDDFIRKPFSGPELIKKVEKVLNSKIDS